MKILIVGGAGEVGRYLAKANTQAGHRVRILDMAPKSEAMADDPLITYLQGNQSDKALVREAVSDIDVVIDLAWSFADSAQAIFGTDLIATANLLEAAVSAGVPRFIYASTAVVYGRAVHHLIKTAKGNGSLEMVRGAGGAFVTMNDLAAAIRLIIERPVSAGQTYNVGSLFLTWEEIGTMMIQETNSSAAVQCVPPDRWHRCAA